MIKVFFFARLREQMGTASESLNWEDSIQALEDIRAKLVERYPEKQEILQARDLLVARNQDMATWSEPVRDGDEVALFPPVTGG